MAFVDFALWNVNGEVADCGATAVLEESTCHAAEVLKESTCRAAAVLEKLIQVWDKCKLCK